MDCLTITLPFLEGFTTDELYTLARSFNIELAPGMERSLVINEFFESVPCIGLYKKDIVAESGDAPNLQPFEPAPPQKTEFEASLPVPLPRNFGFTYLDVLVRDPFWVFAFWEIGAAERRRCERRAGFSSYTLKVELDGCPEESSVLFTSKIAANDTSRYLNFARELPCNALCRTDFCRARERCFFILKLCALFSGIEETLIASKPFKLPKILPLPGEDGSEILDDPIMRLSGIGELDVLRSVGAG